MKLVDADIEPGMICISDENVWLVLEARKPPVRGTGYSFTCVLLGVKKNGGWPTSYEGTTQVLGSLQGSTFHRNDACYKGGSRA